MCTIYGIIHGLATLWSYANTIETLVLLVIVYDIVWHRLNVIRESKRAAEAEIREIERERLAEERQIRRERQEMLRKHWQELQSTLILLNGSGSQVAAFRKFVKEHNDSQDPTIHTLLSTMAERFPIVLSDFNAYWGRAVAQLNVFPQPRDVLALRALEVIQEIGKSIGNFDIEIKDETLQSLAELVPEIAGQAALPV
jgi:hypothetical protein